jgi:hypothetical protein
MRSLPSPAPLLRLLASSNAFFVNNQQDIECEKGGKAADMGHVAALGFLAAIFFGRTPACIHSLRV